MPTNLSGYLIDEVDIFVMYQANFPASVEAAGQIIRVPQKYSTYLPENMKTQHVCGMSPSDTPQTKQPDMLTHAGLHSHSDGRAVHSQK